MREVPVFLVCFLFFFFRLGDKPLQEKGIVLELLHHLSYFRFDKYAAGS